MSATFTSRTLDTPGLFQKIFGGRVKHNALIELNNALAKADDVRKVTLDTVSALNSKYQTNIHHKYQSELATLYRVFLDACLNDREFSQAEIAEVWHLKSLFGISDKEHENYYQEVAAAIYKRSLREVLADSSVSPKEKALLENLSAFLKLSNELKTKIILEVAGPVLKAKMESAIQDKQLSPQEEEEMSLLCRSLGIGVTLTGEKPETLEKLRLMWQIKNAPLPTKGVPIQLQRGEACHLVVEASLFETTRVLSRISYRGPRFHIKIVKGLYWNAGTTTLRREDKYALSKIDSGTLYLTNKRLIFCGEIKNATIRLGSIIDFTPYRDGMEIEKDSGGKLAFSFKTDVEIFAAILGRCLHDITSPLN